MECFWYKNKPLFSSNRILGSLTRIHSLIIIVAVTEIKKELKQFLIVNIHPVECCILAWIHQTVHIWNVKCWGSSCGFIKVSGSWNWSSKGSFSSGPHICHCPCWLLNNKSRRQVVFVLSSALWCHKVLNATLRNTSMLLCFFNFWM